MSHPAPGTTRYLCPLECGWHHDVQPPSPADLAGIVPHPAARDMSEAVSSIASQAAFRQLERTEEALRGHLDTHTTVEFARVIHDLRAEIEQLRNAGQTLPAEERATLSPGRVELSEGAEGRYSGDFLERLNQPPRKPTA